LRFCWRCFEIALISTGMLLLQFQPSQAAPPSTDSQTNAVPSAVITLANLAHIGRANAVGGTTVYPGDTLDTAPEGELRFTIGAGQVYLLSDTAANIVRSSGSVLQAAIVRGTIGFSSLTDQQFQIVTPEGIVEAADGLPAFGQVTVTGPNDIVISAYTGALVLHRGAQTLLVKAGQSYYVSLVPDAQPPQRRAGVVPAYNYHLEWRLVVVAAAAGIGYYLWQLYDVSPSIP
jgi:hypothetical protein